MKAKKLRQKITALLFLIFSFIAPPSHADIFTPMLFMATSTAAMSAAFVSMVSSFAASDKKEKTPANITATDVIFIKPGTKTITLTNSGDTSATIGDIIKLSGVSEIEPGIVPAACKPLAGGGTCEVELTASDDASGDGTATFTYGASEVSASVSVKSANVTATDVSFTDPGDETTTITNNSDSEVSIGDTITYNDVSGVSATVSDDCDHIRANGGTCKVTFTASKNATGDGTASFDLFGLSAKIFIKEAKVTATNVNFTEPNTTETITLTNIGTNSVTITDVSFSEGVKNVSKKPFTCELSGKDSMCEVELEADTDAYGSGTATFSHSLSFGKISSSVSVANTSLSLYMCMPRKAKTVAECTSWVKVNENDDIELEREKTPQLFKYTVEGAFFWQKNSSAIDWKPGFEFPKVGTRKVLLEEVNTDDSECSQTKLAPSRFCIFQFVDDDGQDNPGSSGTFRAPGLNLPVVGMSEERGIDKNVVGKGGIEILPNATDIHLGCKALKVVNTTDDSVQITSIDVSIPEGSLVKYCSDNSCCNYDKCQEGNPLAAGTANGCNLWLKAEDATELGAGAAVTVTVTVAVNSTPSIDPEVDIFTVVPEQSLYVGGRFTDIKGDTANKVARWNGTSWFPLGTGANNGVNGTVKGFVIMDGDLYVGGEFTSTGGGEANYANHVAKWNGVSWLPLEEGVNNGVNGNVHSLEVIGTNLYIGGEFTAEYGGTPGDLNRIAKWDGASWSPLGSGITDGTAVYGFATDGTNLYVGGNFTEAGGDSANSIAKWDGASWSPLGVGVFYNDALGTINALEYKDPYLYAGGYFTHAGGVSAIRIARWHTTSESELWGTVGRWDAIADLVGSEVRSLLVLDNYLYVGGIFAASVSGGTYNARGGLVKWDMLAEKWLALGDQGYWLRNGITGNYARGNCFAAVGRDLYVGGNFSSVKDIYDYPPTYRYQTNNLAKWNNTLEHWTERFDLGLSEIYFDDEFLALASVPSLAITEHKSQ